jgi:hypothetical protein
MTIYLSPYSRKKWPETVACGIPKMSLGCLSTMLFLTRWSFPCKIINNRHKSYKNRLARPTVSDPVTTPVNLLWLLAGLFHTYQSVLLLPIASNTCVQLLQCKKIESPRVKS